MNENTTSPLGQINMDMIKRKLIKEVIKSRFYPSLSNINDHLCIEHHQNGDFIGPHRRLTRGIDQATSSVC